MAYTHAIASLLDVVHEHTRTFKHWLTLTYSAVNTALPCRIILPHRQTHHVHEAADPTTLVTRMLGFHKIALSSSEGLSSKKIRKLTCSCTSSEAVLCSKHRASCRHQCPHQSRLTVRALAAESWKPSLKVASQGVERLWCR